MTHTRFTPDVDLDGLTPDDAFAILGNEIRLAVIRELWRAEAARRYDDGPETAETMAYSELQAAVGVEDNGKFNYHLSKLEPHFVRRTEAGYRLSGAGKGIARTVIAVSGTDGVDLAPELSDPCPLCGGAMVASYDDQWLRVRCTACDGLFGDQAPTGTLFLTHFPAAGVATRSPDEALATGLYRCVLDITYLVVGICRECAGPVSGSVTVCESHDPGAGEGCGDCGTPFRVWAELGCETCGFAKRLPVEMFATGILMATGMTTSRDFTADALSLGEAIDVLRNRVETGVSRNPLRVSVSVSLDAGTVELELDDGMAVVGFERHPPTDAVEP